MEACSSRRCAVTQHQCTAALFRAKCSPNCSVLLCKSGSSKAVWPCNNTYGYLLFVQVCIDPAPMPVIGDIMQQHIMQFCVQWSGRRSCCLIPNSSSRCVQVSRSVGIVYYLVQRAQTSCVFRFEVIRAGAQASLGRADGTSTRWFKLCTL